MPPIFCATLLALCILFPFAACKLPLSSHRHPPKNVPSFSFTTHKPVSIPLRIAVVLVGFDGTGQSAVTLNPVELEEYWLRAPSLIKCDILISGISTPCCQRVNLMTSIPVTCFMFSEPR